MIGKGGGSAYGGEWKPSKPEDERLVGKPGEIKVTYKKDGTKVETKIGEDGRAVSERHHTEHSPNGVHSNPHDHKINWSTPRYGIPNFSKPIKYWGDVPDFKYYHGVYSVKNYYNSFEDNRFKTISDFKESMICGGEVVFEWNHEEYGVFRMENNQGTYCISRADGQNMKWSNTLDDLLEYYVGSDRLRDVITKVTVIDRTL